PCPGSAGEELEPDGRRRPEQRLPLPRLRPLGRRAGAHTLRHVQHRQHHALQLRLRGRHPGRRLPRGRLRRRVRGPVRGRHADARRGHLPVQQGRGGHPGLFGHLRDLRLARLRRASLAQDQLLARPGRRRRRLRNLRHLAQLPARRQGEPRFLGLGRLGLRLQQQGREQRHAQRRSLRRQRADHLQRPFLDPRLGAEIDRAQEPRRPAQGRPLAHRHLGRRDGLHLRRLDLVLSPAPAQPAAFDSGSLETDMKTYSMFVDGELVPAASGETETIANPATEEPLALVPTGSSEDVERAVEAAATAFETWCDSTPADRSLLLLKLADRIEQNAEELATLEARNVGKPITLARSELPFVVDNLRFFAGAARCQEGKAAGEYLAGYTSMIRREPIGVVGLIAPWNYPLLMAIWKIGPSLAAGNTVILKPSEQTPLTALRLAELAADLFPPGVFNVITGHGLPVGAPLVAHPKVGMVSLTGDVATGMEVARAAASTLKRVHLELGGKAPVVIFDDADLDLAVPGIKFAGFANSGQDCTAACRLYA